MRRGLSVVALGVLVSSVVACAAPLVTRERGLEHYYAGRYAEAIAVQQELVRRNPGDTHALTDLGIAFIAVQRYGDAISCLTRALQLQPGNHLAHYNLGIAFHQVGRDFDALDQFDDALALQPNLVRAHYAAALSCAELYDDVCAISAFRNYLQVATYLPSEQAIVPKARYLLAVVSAELARYEQEMQLAREAEQERANAEAHARAVDEEWRRRTASEKQRLDEFEKQAVRQTTSGSAGGGLSVPDLHRSQTPPSTSEWRRQKIAKIVRLAAPVVGWEGARRAGAAVTQSSNLAVKVGGYGLQFIGEWQRDESIQSGLRDLCPRLPPRLLSPATKLVVLLVEGKLTVRAVGGVVRDTLKEQVKERMPELASDVEFIDTLFEIYEKLRSDRPA
jgi:Flp pilus assembly protein TadD